MNRETPIANDSSQVELEQRIALSGMPVVSQSVVSAPFTSDSAQLEIASGPALYVSTSGSNSNDGSTPQQAFRTIQEAAMHTTPGTTILVMPGVYNEHIVSPRGGTSWDAPVRIAAYDPTNRPVIRANAGQPRVFTFAADSSRYIELDGLVIDAVNVVDGIKITSGTQGASSHIRVQNTEIKNSQRQGVLITGSADGVSHNVFSNVEVHSNGASRLDHGFYINSPYTIIEDSHIYNNAGWGIHNYGGNPSHNIYRNNRVEDNDQIRDGGVGIGVYMGSDVQVYGNVVTGSNYAGIAINYGAVNAVIRDNVVYGNRVIGIGLGTGAGIAELDGNLVYNQPINVQVLTTAALEFGSVDPYDAVADGSSGSNCYNQVSVQGAEVDFYMHCSSGSNVLASFPAELNINAEQFLAVDPEPAPGEEPEQTNETALDQLLANDTPEARELVALAAAMLNDWGVNDSTDFMSNLDEDALASLLSVAAVAEDLEQILAAEHAEMEQLLD